MAESNRREAVVELPRPGVAGQWAMREALAAQEDAPPRSLAARVFGLSPLSSSGRGAYRTALGERSVGNELDRLGPGWHVLHAIEVGENGAHLDHLVIGPAGVFIVEPAVHPGATVWVDSRAFLAGDHRHPYIRTMEYEIGRVERLLGGSVGAPLEVSGILAVVDPRQLTVGAPHRDVEVMRSSALVRWLRSRPARLSPTEVDRIARVAVRVSTWEASSASIHDPIVVREDFDVLRRDVDRASVVQRIWMTALATTGAGVFVLAIYGLALGMGIMR